jgi:hypothetical protein
MAALTGYHFDLSWYPVNQAFTFHKRGRVYPIRRHTEASRNAAIAAHPRLASLDPARITHFVEGVDTPSPAGVVIQAVKTPVQVDGPNGPNTQTFDQIVSYAISIPAYDDPFNGNEALAFALMFMHNNLMSLDSSSQFFIPIFILQNCIQPNASDLIDHISAWVFTGKTWISDPYPVMLSATEHLVYPDEDPQTNQPSPLAGQWVYSQRLNADALQPALSSCLAAALRVAKNAPELEGVSWSVQNAVLSSTYNAQPVTSPPAAAARNPLPAGAGDSGSVTWTMANLTPGYGLSVDTRSLNVDMSKDTWEIGYAGQMTFQCTNSWLRHLSAYVEFLQYQGNTLVPISLGSCDPQAVPPNNTWWGDFVNDLNNGDYLYAQFGFIEPSDSKKFLQWVNPTGTICGIPVPSAPTTITINYIPTDANVVRVYWGGLGQGPYDQDVCAVGITLTAVFELALPMMLLMFDAATVDSKALTESFWAQKGLMLNLLQTVLRIVMNADLNAATMVQQDAEVVGKFLAQDLLPDLLQTGCAYGAVLMAKMGVGAVMEAIPFVDIASLIFNSLVTAAQLGQTIVEVAESPFVFQTDIARTFDLSLTIKPDANMHEFPPEAMGGTYRVSIDYSINSTPAVVELDMSATTKSNSIPLLFTNLPAGGQIQVSVYMYSPTGWQAGQGQTAWSNAQGDNNTPMKSVCVTVINNPPPLDKFSVYQFVEKTVFQGGTRVWQGITSSPPAQQPVATQQTETNITELNGLTISQNAGMLGYTFQTNGSPYTTQNISLLQNPQSAYAALSGITVMPALAYQRTGPFDGSGLNFYLDADPATNPGSAAHLRQLSLVWTQAIGSQPPNMNPDPGMSWGQFPFPMDRLAAFNNYVAGISYDFLHTKIYIIQVPDLPVTIAEAPHAYMISGPGTRLGLMSLPRAITFGMQGQILVLEAGATPQIQAFDVNGNSYLCFGPTGSGVMQATAPLVNLTPETVLLDLAVEPRGYMYVLSYDGLGSYLADYHLDLYLPNGGFLARTNNFAAANVAVDIIRDVYTLNYEALENSPTLEPSVSLWIPPVKSYSGTVTVIQGATIVMQDQHNNVLNISTSSATLFTINSQSGSLSGVSVSDTLTAFGSMRSDGTLNATQIFVPTTTA